MWPDFKTLDELTRKLADTLPERFKAAGEDVEKRMRQVLEAQFARVNLVTREEFEIQQRVLERTREKLEQLERRLDESGKREPEAGA
ncbi:MAG: accessory factor UbiK family protein [Wenzhouxiangellaceae bacterium]|nr:accessory factor UbiK family protein [Wenzhouxiangellaceae bacterium]